MGHLIHAPASKTVIIQSPADIIMAPQIIQEGIFARQMVHTVKLFFQKSGILRCHSIPDGCHGRHIVEHMALRLLWRSKIRHDLFRFHHHFAKQQNSRTYDLTDHTHHPDDRMDLLQISAGGSKLFPDVRNRIDPDDINAQICKIQEIIHHLIENHRIRII